jgi:hypothetical protein
MIEFAVYHRLVKMWTTTYDVLPESIGEVIADAARLRRRLYEKFGKFPNHYVVELGAETGRLHLHWAFPNFFIDKHFFQEAWGKGIVQYDLRRNSAGEVVEDAETLAHYLAKDLGLYLSKDFEVDNGVRKFGGHRYHPSRDDAVPVDDAWVRSLEQAREFIASKRGDVVLIWCSLDVEECEFGPTWVYLDEGRYCARSGSP